MADDSVIVKFGGSIEGLTGAVDQARGAIETLAEPFTRLQASLAGFGEAFAAAFAVEQIHSFAESMAELGTNISRDSQILGVSIEQVAGLDLLAKASGGSIDELTGAFGKFSKNVADESEPTKRALGSIGISFQQIRDLSPEKQLELLATKFSGFADGAGKAAAAQMLFGRAGVQLIPTLNEGAEGIQKWFDAAQELEPNLARNVEGMEAMHRALVEMDAAIQGASIAIFEHFGGAIMGAIQGIRDLAVGFTKATQEGGSFADSVELLDVAIKALGVAFTVAKLFAEEFFATLDLGASLIGEAVNEAAEQTKKLIHFDFSGGAAEWSFYGDQVKQTTAKYTRDIVQMNKDAVAQINGITGAVAKKPEAGAAPAEKPKPAINVPPPASAEGGTNDALEAAKKEIDGEIKAAQEGLTLKETIWNGEVAAHKMSKEQELQMVIQATNQEYAAELVLLEKEKALQGQKPAQIQEINNKIEQLEAKHTLTMVKLNQQAAQESMQAWENFFEPFNSQFNSAFKGLITGTENFQKIWKSALTDILMAFIQNGEKMVEQWAIDTGIMAALSAALNAATGGLGGILGSVAGVMKIAPPGGFATGAWELPRDMIAQVHAGEMIVPAGPAAAIRSGAAGLGAAPSGGGHSTNIHINAVDAAGVQRMFNANDGALLKSLHRAASRGAGLGLSRF
jgi:hypothetical protein